MIEPCYIEFTLDGQAFKQEYSSRVPGGSISYALGLWARGKVPDGIEEIWDALDLDEEGRMCTTIEVAHEAMTASRLKLQATNLLKPGPEIIWVTKTSDGERWLHCLMSAVIPDHITLDHLEEWFKNHSKFPANLINAELQRIQHLRSTVHVFGER